MWRRLFFSTFRAVNIIYLNLTSTYSDKTAKRKTKISFLMTGNYNKKGKIIIE